MAIAIEVRGQGAGRVRLQAIPDAGGDSRCRFVAATTSIGAIVHTDGFAGYNGLAQFCFDHRPRSRRSLPPGDQLLPRAHRAVSNLKACLHGTHRDVSRRHLQVYLDEYTFRHNRRGTPMAAFQTLLGLSTLHQPTTYRQITRRAAQPQDGANRIPTSAEAPRPPRATALLTQPPRRRKLRAAAEARRPRFRIRRPGAAARLREPCGPGRGWRA